MAVLIDTYISGIFEDFCSYYRLIIKHWALRIKHYVSDLGAAGVAGATYFLFCNKNNTYTKRYVRNHVTQTMPEWSGAIGNKRLH